MKDNAYFPLVVVVHLSVSVVHVHKVLYLFDQSLSVIATDRYLSFYGRGSDRSNDRSCKRGTGHGSDRGTDRNRNRSNDAVVVVTVIVVVIACRTPESKIHCAAYPVELFVRFTRNLLSPFCNVSCANNDV